MKSTDLKEKMEKAQAALEKRYKTTEKYVAQLEKMKANILSVGVVVEKDFEDLNSIKWNEEKRAAYKNACGRDMYWDLCDYTSKEVDIKDSEKKYKEQAKIVANWTDKYNKAVVTESVLYTKIPEAFLGWRDDMIAYWDEWDVKRRDKLSEEYNEVGWKKFTRQHPYSDYEFISFSDERIHNQNLNAANSMVLDLYSRIFKYTGEITDIANLHIRNGHINGFVVGERTAVEVTSILAGGYNIQRLHVRVLVNPVNRKEK